MLVAFQTRGRSLESLGKMKQPMVRNFVEAVCAVESNVEVSDIRSLDDLCILYSKGGLNSGSLSQAFPLAASEQFILDPLKVSFNRINHSVYDYTLRSQEVQGRSDCVAFIAFCVIRTVEQHSIL